MNKYEAYMKAEPFQSHTKKKDISLCLFNFADDFVCLAHTLAYSLNGAISTSDIVASKHPNTTKEHRTVGRSVNNE
jgi:hypothetical protein